MLKLRSKGTDVHNSCLQTGSPTAKSPSLRSFIVERPLSMDEGPIVFPTVDLKFTAIADNDLDHPTAETVVESEYASDTLTNSFTTAATDITIEAPDASPERPSAPERQRSVRFRSRVRITSGLNRQRHRHLSPSSDSQTRNEGDARAELDKHADPSPSISSAQRPIPSRRRSSDLISESSLSGSSSSSISAPLRTQEDESTKSRWGPLGQRVNYLRYKKPRTAKKPGVRDEVLEKFKRRQYDERWEGHCVYPGCTCGGMNPHVGERTPLVGGSSLRAHGYVVGEGVQGCSDDSDSENDLEMRLNREIDLIFGKWPGRLLNRHVRVAAYFIYKVNLLTL